MEPVSAHATALDRAQLCIEHLDAFEQIKRESGTGQVYPQIALQVQRDARALQAAGGEAQVAAASASGLQYALLYQVLNELGLDSTGAAQVGQGESGLLVDQFDGRGQLVFFTHGIRIPPLSRAG